MALDAGVLDAKHPIAKHFEMAADCDCARESNVGVSLRGSVEQEDSNNGVRATRPTALQDEFETGIAGHPVVASSKEITEDATGILSVLILSLVTSIVSPL